MAIIRFTNKDIPLIQNDIAAALKVIADKHGIALTSRFTKGTALTLGFTMSASIKDASQFGKTFRHKSHQYRITGVNPGAWRYPVLTERLRDGATVAFPADVVSRYLPKVVAKAA